MWYGGGRGGVSAGQDGRGEREGEREGREREREGERGREREGGGERKKRERTKKETKTHGSLWELLELEKSIRVDAVLLGTGNVVGHDRPSSRSEKNIPCCKRLALALGGVSRGEGV